MDSLRELYVEMFMSKQESHLENTLDYLLCDPDSRDKKIKKLKSLVLKGIEFGFEKGAYIEESRLDKVNKYKDDKLVRKLEEDLAKIDDEIAEFISQNKYKKK